MPRIAFLTPEVLVLLALIPPLFVLALFAPRRLARWRIAISLLLRTLLFTALILALAGIQLVLPAQTLTAIFLLDRSDSVSAAQRATQEQYVGDALRSQHPNDRTGVVLFGQNALVERAPAQLSALGRLTSAPIGARTNLQDAVQLGLALFPDDTQKRLVLLSDGGENSGRVGEALRLARARGIPIDVVNLPSSQGPDVLVQRVEAPATARENQEIAVGIDVRATVASQGELQVFVDGNLVLRETRSIPAGDSSLAVRIPAGASGYRRIDVRIEASGDSNPQNNRAAALTEVQGPPRILIIASEPVRAANLRQAIAASGAQPEVVAPNQAPADLTQLSSYASVVLFDTPARELPHALLEALPTYVRDLGGGLAMVGGTRSFGAGGYRRTSIEPILPVLLDPLDTSQQPDVALTLVIDHSGSMSDSAGGSGGRTKLDLAKESVYQASLGLAQRDQVGLVIFDEAAKWVLPLQKLPDATAIEQALSQFGPGGGTNIRPGIELASSAMKAVNAKIKHIILLTDGIAESNYSDIIDTLKSQGVMISTVAIGDDANPNLQDIATRGGGRFYQVRQVSDVPNIFLQETVLIAGRDIVETDFTPAIALESPIVRGLNGLPALRGYNGTEQKPTARTILVSPDGKPILAQEQIGLGRTVAWTSDFDGRWSSAWLQWAAFPRFAGGLIDLLVAPRATSGLSLQATTQGDQAVLDLTAQDANGQPLNNATLDARLVDPHKQSAPLVFTQVGPGRYRATASAADTGVYLAQLAARDANGQPIGNVSAGVAVSYSPEYGERRENPALLSEIATATNGRTNPPAVEAYAPLSQAVGRVTELGLPLLLFALLLLPFDIAVRRLFVPLGRFLPAGAPKPASAYAPIDATISRLNEAKQRVRNQPAPTPTAPPIAPTPEQPATRQTPKAQRSAALNDEQFARLLAAKRRARSEREE